MIKLTGKKFGILINIKYYLKTKLASNACIAYDNTYVALLCSCNAYNWLRRPKTTFLDIVVIISVAPPSLDNVCNLLTFGLTSMIFSFFFHLFSLLLATDPLNFQSNPSIYFSFKFDLCSFDYYLFIWNNLLNLIFLIYRF